MRSLNGIWPNRLVRLSSPLPTRSVSGLPSRWRCNPLTSRFVEREIAEKAALFGLANWAQPAAEQPRVFGK